MAYILNLPDVFKLIIQNLITTIFYSQAFSDKNQTILHLRYSINISTTIRLSILTTVNLQTLIKQTA